MNKKRKKRVVVYLTNDMYQDLKKQANALGLSMSSYFAYLLLSDKERRGNNVKTMERVFKSK